VPEHKGKGKHRSVDRNGEYGAYGHGGSIDIARENARFLSQNPAQALFLALLGEFSFFNRSITCLDITKRAVFCFETG